MKRVLFCAMCGVTLLAGCVTSKTIMVTSEPAGAAIYLDGEQVGKTPAKIKVEFPETGQGITEKKILQLRMTGYKEQKEVLSDCGSDERALKFSLELEGEAAAAPQPAEAVASAPSVTPSGENKTAPDVISAPASTQTPETK